MLNSEYIHLKINSSETCFPEDNAKFKELIELYPYATTFSILFLKSLSNAGDIRLENELEKLAFRINDRGVLYNLIHAQPSEKLAIDETPKEIVSAEKQQVNLDESTVKSDLEGVTFEIKSNNLETTTENEIPENALEIKNNKQEEELEKLIASAAIASTFVERELEHLPELTQELGNNAVYESDEEKNVNSQETNSIEEQKTINSSPKSFTDWLKLSASSFDEETKDEEIRTPEYYTFEKPKKEFFSPTKKAKESLDENKMPVSETLAKIFALQGNFSKAIYVYDQLILIFPEKKTFFATQIKNLKKKINP